MTCIFSSWILFTVWICSNSDNGETTAISWNAYSSNEKCWKVEIKHENTYFVRELNDAIIINHSNERLNYIKIVREFINYILLVEYIKVRLVLGRSNVNLCKQTLIFSVFLLYFISKFFHRGFKINENHWKEYLEDFGGYISSMLLLS